MKLRGERVHKLTFRLEMAIFELELSFSADLTRFLRRDSRDQGLIRRMLAEKTGGAYLGCLQEIDQFLEVDPHCRYPGSCRPVELQMLPAWRVRSLDRVGPW